MPGFENGSPRGAVLLGAVSIALCVSGFLLLYWNRFLAGTAGGAFFFFGEQVADGKIPYVDFFFVAPPLHGMKVAALLQLFGPTLAVTRIEAIIERVALAVLLYLWVARLVRPASAFFASLLAMVLFMGDRADPIASYHHDAVLWAVASGFCAHHALTSQSRWAGFMSGALAGAAFLTKQTVGLGVTFVLPLTVVLLALRRRAVNDGLSFTWHFVSGWVLPVALMWTWLIHLGAFEAYLQQNFITGTAAKGGRLDILLRPIALTFEQPYLYELAAIGLLYTLAVGVVLLFSRSSVETRNRGSEVSKIRGYVFLGMIALATGGVLGLYAPSATMSIELDLVRRPGVSISLFGSGALALLYWWKYIRGPITSKEAGILLASTVSFVVSYMLALSWPMYEPMVVPALAFIVALVLNRSERAGRAATIVVLALGFVAMAAQGYAKLALPFSWAEWPDAPIADATAESELPALRGLKLSPQTVSFVERVTGIIVENSSPEDTIYVYPYAPLFYSLSQRKRATFAFTHFIDVAPDWLSVEEAERLAAARPAVIVYFVESEGKLRLYETIFRGGKPSGQRILRKTITALSEQYQLLYSGTVPGTDQRIEIYGRSDQSDSETFPSEALAGNHALGNAGLNITRSATESARIGIAQSAPAHGAMVTPNSEGGLDPKDASGDVPAMCRVKCEMDMCKLTSGD